MPARLRRFVDGALIKKNLEYGYRLCRGALFDRLNLKLPDPTFIVGCSRAGTTLLFETMALHPHIQSVGYELPQMWHRIHGPEHNHWHSEAASADDAQPAHRKMADRQYFQLGLTKNILDKTCINTLRIGYLHKLYPEARFIYIYRDGRDNISSLINGWRHQRHFDLQQFLGAFPDPVSIEGGEFRSWSFFLPPGWRDYNQSSLADVCAYQWICANQMAREALASIPETQWRMLKYESLVADPVSQLQPIYNWLGLEFNHNISRQILESIATPTSIVRGKPEPNKWRKQNPNEIEQVLPVIQPLMQEMGYEG